MNFDALFSLHVDASLLDGMKDAASICAIYARDHLLEI